MGDQGEKLVGKKDTILLIDNCQESMIVSLKARNQISWRKKKIDLKQIIGQPFNSIYSLDTWCKCTKIPKFTQLHNEDPEEPVTKVVVLEKDNRNLIDGNDAQKMTGEEIQDLKNQGLDGETIVKMIQDNSKTFETKTEFSQQKFVKKKMQKHLFEFIVLELTLEELVKFQYKDNPFKVCGLRVDSLALFMHHAYVKPDLQCLIFDRTKGIILAMAQQKMQGQGNIVLHQNERSFNSNPNFQLMNINSEFNSCIRFDNLVTIAKEENRFQRLLVAGHSQNLEILQKVFDTLKPGCILVFHCQFQEVVFQGQPLVECYEWMTEFKRCVMVQLFDVFTREHQVLEKRTHPLTSMDAFSGYVLVGYKANPDT